MNTHLYIQNSLAAAARWRSSPLLVSTNPEWLSGMALLSMSAAEPAPRAPALPSTYRRWSVRLAFQDNLSLSQFCDTCERSPVKFAVNESPFALAQLYSPNDVLYVIHMFPLHIFASSSLSGSIVPHFEGGTHTGGYAWYILARSMTRVRQEVAQHLQHLTGLIRPLARQRELD